METKTELVSVSEDVAVSSEKVGSAVAESVSVKNSSAQVSEDSTAEKKPRTRRTTRTAGKRKAVASEPQTESLSEEPKQTLSPSEETPSVKSDAPVSAVDATDLSKESDKPVPAAEKKPSRRKTPAKKASKSQEQSTLQAESLTEEPKQQNSSRIDALSVQEGVAPVKVEQSADEMNGSEEKPSARKDVKKAPKNDSSIRSKKKEPKKGAKRMEEEDARKQEAEIVPEVHTEPEKENAIKTAELPVTLPPSEETSDLQVMSRETETIASDSTEERTSREKSQESTEDKVASEAILSEISKPDAPVSTVVSVFERKESASEEIDVSGTPKDTFVFFSPSQLAQMEQESSVEPISNPEETVESLKNEGPTEVSPDSDLPLIPLMTQEDDSADKIVVAVSEVEEDSKKESLEETVAQEVLASPERPIVTVSEVKEASHDHRAEKRIPRRGDPHERDVMDKERVYRNLFEVLSRTGEIERRTLIEETMKTIPLTDEERLDNQPTSLSNRVRSVIGSILAEQLASGKIVASGKKLTLPATTQSEPTGDVPEEPTVAVISDTEAPEVEATVEIEIELKDEEAEVPEKPAADSVILGFTEDVEQPFADTDEAALEAESAPEVNARRGDAFVREPAVRRVRQPRGERVERGERRPVQQTVPMQASAAVLITEDELERVILNAVRRNSATKNDLFAALKHVYVEPNRLSKEEENRIYGVAGNVLQKLVNRGTLQNSDGRYLQKPSQRILNPGRAPGAYSTGNVEARFITELNRQSGDFFEQFAARLLEKYFEMSNVRVDASYVVGGSDDNGIDIMIETTDWLGYKERVFVQAKKRATQPVTLKEVREFYGALCAEEGTRGVFITTSSFCMEASKMIGKIRNLIAIDKRKLFALAEHCEVGLVRDENGRLLLDENLFLDYDV